MRILGIASCLHAKAVTKELLRVAYRVAPAGVYFEIADIGRLPLYQRDLPNSNAHVDKFREQVELSNAILFSTLEFPRGYGYSVTGPLQNALDWAAHNQNLLLHKPAAFIGVDGFPTVEPNCFHLRKITETLGCHNMQHYQLSVTEKNYLDENREFCDAQTAPKLAKALISLDHWARHCIMCIDQGDVHLIEDAVRHCRCIDTIEILTEAFAHQEKRTP